MFVSDLIHRNARLEAKLRQLYALNAAKKIDLSFRAQYLDLLKAFGDPHKKLPPTIHVAGTNGKGSIIATLRSILEAQGYKVHAYTSPHLCAFNERIYLAGKHIDDAALENLIDRALDLNKGKDCTFFEITTAIAFEAFSSTPADILLLETGLGGRLDCTNVIEAPIATIISAIGHDHMEFLGDNLRIIAGEKAGIMKRGVPCVISAQSEQAIGEGVMNVFKTKARETHSTLYRAGSEWVSEAESDRLHFVGKFVEWSVDKMLPLPNLLGEHQIENCGAALEALEVIASRLPVSNAAIEQGLQSIDWPARLQNITQNFRSILPPDWKLWLDGGHNESAGIVLSRHVDQWSRHDGKNTHLIVGMMNHKDPAAFIAALKPMVKSIRFTDIPGEPNALKNPQNFPDFKSAINDILTKEPGPARILIAGSLYLAGHVLKSVEA